MGFFGYIDPAVLSGVSGALAGAFFGWLGPPPRTSPLQGAAEGATIRFASGYTGAGGYNPSLSISPSGG